MTVYEQVADGFPSTNSQGQLQTPQSVSVHRNEPSKNHDQSWGSEFDKQSPQVPKSMSSPSVLKYDTATSCVMRKYTSWQTATMSLRNENQP